MELAVGGAVVEGGREREGEGVLDFEALATRFVPAIEEICFLAIPAIM